MTADIDALKNQRADALARAQDLAERCQRLYDALLWMTGAAEFREGGAAYDSYMQIVAPLIADPRNGIGSGLQRMIGIEQNAYRIACAIAGLPPMMGLYEFDDDLLVSRATALAALYQAVKSTPPALPLPHPVAAMLRSVDQTPDPRIR